MKLLLRIDIDDLLLALGISLGVKIVECSAELLTMLHFQRSESKRMKMFLVEIDKELIAENLRVDSKEIFFISREERA